MYDDDIMSDDEFLERLKAMSENQEASDDGEQLKRRQENDRRVQFHLVTDMGWTHSHGMVDLGLPELEIRGFPGFLAEDAARLLKNVCEYMKKAKNPIRVGETMATSPRTSFRFVKADPIPGNEDHYEDERWQIVDVETVCECCGLRPHEKNYK